MDERCKQSKGYSRVAGRAKKKKNNSHFLAKHNTEFSSTSARKLSGRRFFKAQIPVAFFYCFIEFFSVFSAISENVVCGTCPGKVKFHCTDISGAGFKLIIHCDKCEDKSVSNYPKIRYAFEVNRRLIFVFRFLGVGLEGLNKFCGFMDKCAGIANNTYYKCLENVEIAAASVYDAVLRNAVNEEKTMNANHGNVAENCTVSGDGAWKKRSISSLFGVVTLIGA